MTGEKEFDDGVGCRRLGRGWRRWRWRFRARDRRSRKTPAQVSNTPQGGFTLKVNSDLVLTNVVVRDAKTGELVTGLKQSDFSIYENGKAAAD